MTVSYQYDVASSASGGFIRLLFRWKGSVWKVVYREMFLFVFCYVVLCLLYNFALTEGQQRIFEKVVYFCSTFMDLIPLSFMLGFYVSFIAARWWNQFIAIPWPDKLMNIVAMYIPGLDESSRVVRRTLMRYLNLSLVLVLRSISMAVKRRFPTKEHLIEAGFMTKTELEMFQSVPSTEFNTFWIPCTWFINVLREARQECRITDSNGLKLIMEELNEFRSKCGLLWGYDWISIPLVYTQVVTMATYAFFVACMFGRQNVNMLSEKPSSPEVHRYDYYIPVFTILQLMFYMGLLKVAEQLINPFGDDDEDFELNWIIDRHMKVSYLGVDTLNGTPPPLVKDTYYNELDVKIPYTEASKGYKKKTYRGSVAFMQVPMEQQHIVVPDMSEDEDDDGETVSETLGLRRPSMYSLFGGRGSIAKSVSPASSFTNLNKSLTSLDSEGKRSLQDLFNPDDKNASGTLGNIQVPPTIIDMAAAEDDEIVLQEVIVEQNNIPKPPASVADSLQIPGAVAHVPEQGVTSAKFRKLRGVSPKIAPKFPREKLKSMFRKRKISITGPFQKLKEVRFSRDTKDDEIDSECESLLSSNGLEPVEVEITLSTPELTEAEKETGVHPYYFTQQALTSKQLAMGRSFIVRQSSLTRSESEERIHKCYKTEKPLTKSNSLPIIPQSDCRVPLVYDPIIASSLRKFSKRKGGRVKRKEKTPSPEPDDVSEGTIEPVIKTSSESPEIEPQTKQAVVPQITLTEYDLKGSERLDLATCSPITSSEPCSSQSSDSGAQESETSTKMLSTYRQKPKKMSVSEIIRSFEKGVSPIKLQEPPPPPPALSSKVGCIDKTKVEKVKSKIKELAYDPSSKALPTKSTAEDDTEGKHSKPKKATYRLKSKAAISTKEKSVKESKPKTARKDSSSPVTDKLIPSEVKTSDNLSDSTKSTIKHSKLKVTLPESDPKQEEKPRTTKRKSPPPPTTKSLPSSKKPETCLTTPPVVTQKKDSIPTSEKLSLKSSPELTKKKDSLPSTVTTKSSSKESSTSSPTKDIASPMKLTRSPFPEPGLSVATSTGAKGFPAQEQPPPYPTVPKPKKAVVVPESKDVPPTDTGEGDRPPDAPKRQRPRSGSKTK